MIYIDVDGVCVDFIGTARKLGIELGPNEFGSWNWGENKFLSAEQFYKIAKPQKWLWDLYDALEEGSNSYPNFITKDYADAKHKFLEKRCPTVLYRRTTEAPHGKHHFCKHPCDLLIDDNEAECGAWRNKGGIAYWLNLAEDDPFGKFLQWWELKA
jgi:hypothetical protein